MLELEAIGGIFVEITKFFKKEVWIYLMIQSGLTREKMFTPIVATISVFFEVTSFIKVGFVQPNSLSVYFELDGYLEAIQVLNFS